MCTRAHATLHTWLWTEAIHPSSISSEATFGEAEGALNCKYNVNGKGSGNGLALKFPQSWTAFQFHAPRLARRAPTRSAARLDGALGARVHTSSTFGFERLPCFVRVLAGNSPARGCRTAALTFSSPSSVR